MVAVYGKSIAVACGDFAAPDRTDSVFAIRKNNGKTRQLPHQTPTGYKAVVNKHTLVICGINGIDISTDGGANWKNIGKKEFSTGFSLKNSRLYFLPEIKTGVERSFADFSLPRKDHRW